MLPVEILPLQESIVLRARGSELLILADHVKKLKGLIKPRDFSQYFRAEALVNRPARKLFEAWLRKDHTLWPRLYHVVHKEIDLTDGDASGVASAEPQSLGAPKAQGGAKNNAGMVGTKTAPKSEPAAAPVMKETVTTESSEAGKAKVAKAKKAEEPSAAKSSPAKKSGKPTEDKGKALKSTAAASPKKTAKASAAKPVKAAPAAKAKDKGDTKAKAAGSKKKG